MVQEYVDRCVGLSMIRATLLIVVSERDGCGDVRGTAPGAPELLHGMTLNMPSPKYIAKFIQQVSAGEEGIAVGSAAALTPDDVVFAQYREAGVFQQRGFTLKDFMSQLFANTNDTGKGRNMPVHYGQNYPRMVSLLPPKPTRVSTTKDRI